MLVGPTASAKTTTYKVLADSLGELQADSSGVVPSVVDTFIINPKSLTIPEFYGTFDLISHEFTDGVLGKLYRDCTVVPNPPEYQWIIFDGPVEADWI
jgi:dynein heavy chain